MSLNKIPSSEYIYRQFDIINSKLKTLECQIDKIDDAGFQWEQHLHQMFQIT